MKETLEKATSLLFVKLIFGTLQVLQEVKHHNMQLLSSVLFTGINIFQALYTLFHGLHQKSTFL